MSHYDWLKQFGFEKTFDGPDPSFQGNHLLVWRLDVSNIIVKVEATSNAVGGREELHICSGEPSCPSITYVTTHLSSEEKMQLMKNSLYVVDTLQLHLNMLRMTAIYKND